MKNLRVLDYDGFPHDADTGHRVSNADPEPAKHWIDELPEISLDDLVLVTSPNDMVMLRSGKWVRRRELDSET